MPLSNLRSREKDGTCTYHEAMRGASRTISKRLRKCRSSSVIEQQATAGVIIASQSRLARLEAERDNVDTVVFPAELVARAGDPELARSMTGERNLFEFRKSARAGQKAQLRERIAQLKEEIQGLTGQVAAKK